MRPRMLAVGLLLLLAFPYFSAAQAPGQLAAYSFDEGTGTTVGDSSGVGNAATSSGTVWTAGRFRSALYFNGSNSYAIKNPATGFSLTDITVEFWMRTSDTLKTGTTVSYAVAGNVNEFRIFDYSNLQVGVKTVATGPTGIAVNDGRWHHLAVTWRSSDGRLQIYKDGVVAVTRTLATGAAIASGGALVLGQQQGTVGGGFQAARAFRGLLDEFRIYNRVLASAEIQSDQNSAIIATDVTPPTLVGIAANPGRTTAMANWVTTEVANTQVEYGPTTTYGSSTTLDTALVATHAAILSGLQANTLYHYRVRSVDASGNLTVSADRTFTTLSSTAATGVKVAFIGDQGLGPRDPTWALELIRDEGAQIVIHSGDFDYFDDPTSWDLQINGILGASFPYFTSIGNHDVFAWTGYQQKLQARLGRLTDATCFGDLAAQSTCIYKGLLLISTAPGVLGTGHDAYIQDQLAQTNFPWRISSWHVVMNAMQVGQQPDESGWGVYEESRKGGAILATAHEHSYSRTHLMSNFQTQTVAARSNILQIERGKSFAFVSGLGGESVRDQFRNDPWWASIYTWNQGANPGALFCTFGVNDQPTRASCYFKDVARVVPDQFEIVSAVAGGGAPTVSITSPTTGQTVSGTITVSATASDSQGVAGVQFQVDGNNIGAEGTTAPYAVSLNTASSSNGSHVLTAIARNLAGLTTTSSPVTVIFSNPLTISGVSAGSITTSSAAISWTTNFAADSQAEYGTTTAYGQSTVLDPARVTSHSQTLNGLLANTLYHYRVKSKDATGTLVVSGDFTFTTLALTISGVSAGNLSTNSATTTWTTNVAADSQVEYGTTTAYGQSTVLDPARVTGHSQGLTGLLASTTYHYRVKSRDAAGNLAVSDDFIFTTLAPTPGTFRDDFTSTTLDPAWTFTDPVGDSRFSLTANPGHLQIRLPLGTGHECWDTDMTCARMLRNALNVNAEYETKIDGVNINGSYQDYGIMLWQDNSNFIRFEFATPGGDPYVDAYTTVNGQTSQAIAGPNIPLGASNYLRVTRSGNTFTLRFSADGVNWTSSGSFARAGFAVNKVGVYLVNGWDNPATTGNFDYFSVRAP